MNFHTLQTALVLTLLLAPGLSSGPARALDVAYPGISRIGLAPPGKMTPSRRMNGFEDEAGAASILIGEFPPDGYAEIAAGFTDQALAASGLKIVKRGKLDGAPGETVFLIAEQPVEGVALRRYVLVAKLPGLTGLVTVQAPRGSKEYAEPVIRKALASLAVRDELTPAQQLDGLPFRIGDLGGFRFVRTLSGNAVLLTDGPLDRIQGAEQPSVVVASAVGPPVPANERELFARRAVEGLPQTADVRIESDRLIVEGDAATGEIVASARHKETGELLTVYQWVRFTPAGYLRLVGRGKLERMDALLPRFRAMKDALALR